MRALLLTVVNMSYAAACLIPVVLGLRLLMRKLPRIFTCLLWALVLLRLLCPISIESVWSLIPSAQLISPNIIHQETFEIASGISFIDLPINEYLVRNYYEGITVPVGTTKDVVGILVMVWLCGVAAMVTYGVVKGLRHRRQMTETAKTEGGCIRAVSFGVLTLHWFNPLVWAAYFAARRDLAAMRKEAAARRAGEIERTHGEIWLAGTLVVLAVTLLFAGNPVPREHNMTAGKYKTEMVLYSDVAVEDPKDASVLPEFCITEQRDLLVNGENVGKLIATDFDQVESQNLITMSAEGQTYGIQHVDAKEQYKTDRLPDGGYYLVRAYEKEQLEILQVQGTTLWRVYAVGKE